MYHNLVNYLKSDRICLVKPIIRQSSGTGPRAIAISFLPPDHADKIWHAVLQVPEMEVEMVGAERGGERYHRRGDSHELQQGIGTE